MKKYPGGFNNPEMLEMGKKHKMDKMVEMAKDFFEPSGFKKHSEIVEKMNKLVSRSSLVSLFEKPKFRDFSKSLPVSGQKHLAVGLKELLHGNQKQGFEMVRDILLEGKLAKWPLITVVPAYFKPKREVFIKPTTVKGVIETLELENLVYKPQPSWEFYREYRKQINEMKKHVDKSLSPSNAAFSGFLMMFLSV